MIDFKNVSASTDGYNFHSHTQFCDGRSSMADIASAAFRAGFSHWGFSPHSPIPIESPCNMDIGDVAAYLENCECLKEEYAGLMKIYTGMEVDYLDDGWNVSNDYFRSLPLDFTISSVHFIKSKDGEFVDVDGSYDNFRQKMMAFFRNDIRYVVEKFYDTTVQMIETGGFSILGHFDKIANNASQFSPGIEKEAWYRDRITEVMNLIKAKNIVVEINTKSRERFGRFFPAVRYWEALVNSGITLMVNSDAHSADLINASRNEALSILRNIS